MRFLWLHIALILLPIVAIAGVPGDYELDLSRIAGSFRQVVFDNEKCQDMKYQVSQVIDGIQHDMKANEQETGDRKEEFKRVLFKAESLENFISTVGGISNSPISIQQFEMANSMVRGQLKYVQEAATCMGVVSLSINDFVAFYGINSSSIDYTASYSFKLPSGMTMGSGSMGLPSYSLRHIYDNRKHREMNRVVVYDIQCKPF